MDCNLPGSSVHGILQARILERVALPSFRGSSRPRDWTLVFCISCVGRRVLYHWCHLGRHKSKKAVKVECYCPIAAAFLSNIMWLLFLKGFVTMTLESPEEIQDVSCAWKELNRKLSSNAVSQITRMCLLKGNMVGFSRQLPYMFLKTSRFCSLFFWSLTGMNNTVLSMC